MENLLKGIVEFRKNDFKQYKELFQNLCKTQKPHTLFIGCSDSRLIPNLITNTIPGELFVIRNIANIVPYYRKSKEYAATTSAIEYAVLVLNIKNIVICGHSNCGGCGALFNPEAFFKDIPHVKKWLKLAENVKKQVEKQIPEGIMEEKIWLAEQVNIIEQMKHLMSYPFIKDKFQKKEIKIYGWYYIIEKGEILNYDYESNSFKTITV